MLLTVDGAYFPVIPNVREPHGGGSGVTYRSFCSVAVTGNYPSEV